MAFLSAASLSFDGFDDINYAKTFALAPKAGYRWIEFNCWYPNTLTEAKIDDIKIRCKMTGLSPSSIHIGPVGGESRDEQTKDVCHKIVAMQLAKRLGCRRVIFTGYQRGSMGGIKGITKVMKYLAPIAEEMDILLSLENHVGNNIENIQDYQKIMGEISSPNVGICMDTGHFDAASVNMSELINALGERVNHIHLKENNGIGKKEFTRFFEGTTDNDGIVKTMLQRGYTGFFVVEVSPEIGEHDGRPFTIDDTKRPYEHFSQFIQN